MYFDGDNYLGVSSRTLTLGYVAGKSGRVDVQATVPYTIQWLDASGVPTGTAVTGVGTTLTGNSNFTVSIGRDAGADDAVSYLLFTASQDNRTDRNVVSRLRVSGGRWTFDITVTQENPSLYKDRIIRVLSVHEIGSLGTGTPSSASGMALRRILDNTKNFSPTGTVVVGGFAFTEVSNVEMQAVSTGVLEIFNSIKRIINAQDVIYLTYNTAISDELAQAVLAWLRADTGRVLIVGTDTEATNAKLRQYLTSDGTWKYYYQNNIGGNFKRAAQTDANRRFFTTPFGQVAENAVVSRADNYAAYCSDYPSAVTPAGQHGCRTGEDALCRCQSDIPNRLPRRCRSEPERQSQHPGECNRYGDDGFRPADGQSLGVDSGTGVSERMMRPAAVRRFSGTADRGNVINFRQ